MHCGPGSGGSPEDRRGSESGPAELLQPLYSTSTPNKAIELAAEPAELEINGKSVSVQSKVILRFLPSPRLLIQTEPITQDFAEQLKTKLESIGDTVSFPRRGVSVKAWARSINARTITMLPEYQCVTPLAPVGASLAKVIFHLLNFPRFFGPRCDVETTSMGSMYRRDKVVLMSDGWQITISVLRSADDNVKVLKDTGGHAITHVGMIERGDGSPFGVPEAEGLLQALHFFLSMARGFWCAPILYVGFDDQGNRVWEQWGIGQSESWHHVPSWFDALHGELLEEVFSGFHARWRDPIWNEPLRHAVYWYLQGNTGAGVDVGIVLAQAGLELIAWNHLVIDKKTITPTGFKKLWASDDLRLLLSSFGIPLGIPSQLSEIAKLAADPKCKWIDGPHAFTELRNGIVHPVSKGKGKYFDALVEGWKLGQWYLELALLKLCGHNGEYGNRLVRRWEGTVEKVPWAT